eukprot:PITA_32242
MALVTTTSCSILLNGSPSRTFKPSRGLRQGDPLSPFLFILMMEELGRAIIAAKKEGRIQGLRLTQNGDTVTHQQFVDDTMLQGIPTVKEAKAFKQTLYEFAMAGGTEVSLSKSKIFFFNTDISIQRNLSRILGFQRDSLPSKYLGIPLTDKPLNKDIWESITNKLKDKVSEWTNRAFNLAGKLVLTKAILQTIPIYMLSALPAPKGVLQQIRNIQRDFLWGKGEEKNKWALVAWDKICKPKSHGGLGLHDPDILDKVLGAKLWWRWLMEIQKPWAKLWKQKYAMNWQETDLIRMTGHIKGSHIWNKACKNKALVQKHSFWEIRNGNLAWFWEDNWQQEGNPSREELASIQTDTIKKGLKKVSDYWDQSRDNDKWRFWKLPDCSELTLLKTQAKALASILEKRQILTSTSDDLLRWGSNNQGVFNLKEAKRIATCLNFPNTDKSWKDLWNNPHLMKIKLFRKAHWPHRGSYSGKVGTSDTYLSKSNHTTKHTLEGKAFWQLPSQGLLKFNIDGASKANPGDTGYGGVIRDEEDDIKVIFHSHLGKASNIMVELMAMEQCLEILIAHNTHIVIIEADSELVINSVKRIGTGTTLDNISSHWRLLQVYHRIHSHLRILRTLSFVHVRREANSVANWLANEGVRCKRDNMCCKWEEVPNSEMWEDCTSRALTDMEQYQNRQGN